MKTALATMAKWAGAFLVALFFIPIFLFVGVILWIFRVELEPPYDDGCMDAVKDQDERGGVLR